MSRFLPVVVAIAAVQVGASAADAGAAADLGAGMPAWSAAIGSRGAEDFAYLSAPGELAVERTWTPMRIYRVPSGCVPKSMTPRAVALQCPLSATDPRQGTSILTLDSGRLRALPLGRGLDSLTPVTLGRRWLLASASSSPDGEHAIESLEVVDLQTGRVIGLGGSDPFGKHAYPDLDSDRLRRSLCAPVVRHVIGPSVRQQTRYSVVTVAGRWVLLDDLDQQELAHCGSHRTSTFDRFQRAMLGPGVVASLRGRRIQIWALAHHRKRLLSWPGARRPVLALAGRSLLVSEPQASGRYEIYRTPATG